MQIHRSVSEIGEAELVQRLVGSPHWRSRLVEIKGIEATSVPLLQVSLKDAPGNVSGDVDILLRLPDAPERTVAIEVKRIKIRNGHPNKIHEVKKGVRQANLLARLGFAQVYLYVFVMVDSRAHNAGQVRYDDGLPWEVKHAIQTAITTVGLVERVGLIHHEFVQPMDHAPLTVGTYGGHLVRLATNVEQPHELTKWIASLPTRPEKTE